MLVKLVISIVATTLVATSLFASDTSIVFKTIKYREVFEVARAENKPIMLYFHFDGCGACMTMKKTAFKDPAVAEFYNSNFICLDVNTRKDEGVETNKIYNIQMHPTFLFLDAEGNILHRIVSVFNPEEFLVHGHNAMNPQKQLLSYTQRYDNGNRNPDFLYEYCYMLRDAYQLDSFLINEYLNTQAPNDLHFEKNLKFIFEFAIHKGKVCIPFQSQAYLFMYANRDSFAKYHDLDQINARLMFVTQNEVFKSIEKNDWAAFWKSIEYLKEWDTGMEYSFEETDGRITMWTTNKSLVLSAKLAFYEKTKNALEYDKVLNQLIEQIWDDQEALNSMAWSYYLRYDDKSKLEFAVRCSERSLSLNSNYANTDTYACLLFKLGYYDKALKQAEKAIQLAKMKNIDYKETSDLVEKIMDLQTRN